MVESRARSVWSTKQDLVNNLSRALKILLYRLDHPKFLEPSDPHELPVEKGLKARQPRLPL
jgi:hypothetical protein